MGQSMGVGGSIAGDGFFWDHFNRQTMVYLPTNDGVMHGFDAGTGVEVFGYLPDDVVGMNPSEVGGSRDTLRDFVELVVAENNGIPNHQYLLSGLADPERGLPALGLRWRRRLAHDADVRPRSRWPLRVGPRCDLSFEPGSSVQRRES